MNLHDYFVRVGTKDWYDILIRGTRVPIDTIILDYQAGIMPEEMPIRYQTITLEQVYATLTYWLANRDEIDQYIQDGQEYIEKLSQNQLENPSELVQRLRSKKDDVLAKYNRSSNDKDKVSA